MLIKGNVDIFVLAESKIDPSFPSLQFAMDGYTMFRADINADGVGVLVYVREDIPCRQLISQLDNSLEGICLEIDLMKSKWFLFGGYNHEKSNIDAFLKNLDPILDHYMYTFLRTLGPILDHYMCTLLRTLCPILDHYMC